MSDTAATLAAFRRYAALIESSLPLADPFAPEVESDTAIQVERGIIFPMTLLRPAAPAEPVERLLEATRDGTFSRLAVVDRTGHHRPAYRPILVYAWLRAFELAYETLPRPQFGRWEEGTRFACELLEGGLTAGRWDETSTLAARGAHAAELAWTALALHAGGKLHVRDAWTDLASDTFGRFARAQQPSGAFLRAESSDNPETHWYHELAILHAAASYAVRVEDRPLAAAVRRSTEHHLSETQPDHATTLPLGLFAFLWNPQTHPLADGLLHAAQTQQPAGVTGLPAILLADSLECLRLFL